MAFGNPFGLEGSASTGVVSSTSRQLKQDDPMAYIQTDAPINPGNSGGPLVDAEGRVVGINTMIYTRSGGSEGIGFAVPSNVVKNIYDQIRKDGHVHRGHIGVGLQSITPTLAKGLGLAQDWGVVVSDIEPDGRGASGGSARSATLCNALDGKPVENASQLENAIYGLALADERQAGFAARRQDDQGDRAGARARGRSAALRRHGESRGQSGAQAGHSGGRAERKNRGHAAGLAP